MTLTPEQRQLVIGLEKRGRLTAEQVVQFAADKASPLHPLFTWDDKAAAAEHRLDQARRLIREVYVSVRTTTMTVEVQRYVPDPDRGRSQGYVSLEPPPDEAMQRRIVIAEADRALGVMRRAEAIASALGWADGAREALDRWIAWRDAIEEEPQALAAD